MSIEAKRAAAPVVNIFVQRCAGIATSKPHSSEFVARDDWGVEHGRAETAVQAGRQALAAMSALGIKWTRVHGVAELTEASPEELLGRWPSKGQADTGRSQRRWLGAA